MEGGLARAPSLRPPPKGGKAGLRPGQRKAFEAAPPGRVLASEERERARARLRAALARHWLFESFDSKQIEATAKAMRHQSVPQGKVVSAQGEAATKFYVVTEGGFDITVATAAAPAVLVAQAGYLPYISHISPLYLPYISPISPLYLPYICDSFCPHQVRASLLTLLKEAYTGPSPSPYP